MAPFTHGDAYTLTHQAELYLNNNDALFTHKAIAYTE